MNIYLADKFYKYNEKTDETEIVRIIKQKNENTFTCINTETKEKTKKTRDDLENNFIKVKAHGQLVFSIVELELKFRDVIVALYTRDELDKSDMIPFAVCRQNIVDIFTMNINHKKDTYYTGLSINKENSPEGFNFEMTLACNRIIESTIVSCYLDDDIDFLLSLVNHSKFDSTLLSLSTITNKNVMGHCNSLTQLIKENDFQYDFLRAFDINRFDFEIKTMDDGIELIPEQRMFIEDFLKCEMFKTYVIKYDDTINLKKIKRSNVKVYDSKGDIYIIAYDKGDYINRTYKEEIKDKRDAAALLKAKKRAF